MKLKIKRFYLQIFVIIIFLFTVIESGLSYEEFRKTDIENLPFKQELTIPIDTNLENAKYQPIDIRIKFDSPCWAKDENTHSIRVGYDDGVGLIEIESQIYDLKYSDEVHINECSIIFLIPEETSGNENYYVFYDESETNPPEYEDHLKLADTHYFYEPISGQKIDFDYYGIFEEGFVIYAVIQTGEILGNPVALTVGKFLPGSTEVETKTIDHLAGFDMRYGINEEPGYYGSAWATKIGKTVLVDGNLMIRVQIDASSPNGDIHSNNIYTYYYSPTSLKRIYVNTHHEVNENIEIENPILLDGTYSSLSTIQSRSATIDNMNVGNILPSLYVYGEEGIIKEFSVPTDPSTIEPEIILSATDDCDIGENAWVGFSDSSTGKTQGLIFESNQGLLEKEDGLQTKAYVKQNVKLPGLEADTGYVFVTRNSYESGGEHNSVLSQGLSVMFNVEFVTFESEGYEAIDAESKMFQELSSIKPIIRGNVSTLKDEEVERYVLNAYVHLAPSAPMGSLLSAAIGKNFPYIIAELYKDDSLKSSGSAGRLPLGSIDIDLEGKRLIQIVATVVGIFDWRNASFFKKIRFPNVEKGTYVVKIFRENRRLGGEKQFIGYSIVDVSKDTTTRIICRPQGSVHLSIYDQDEQGVEDVWFLLMQDEVVITKIQSDVNGSAQLNAPCYPLQPYTLKTIYNGFLIEEEKIKLGVVQRVRPIKKTYEISLYDLFLTVWDKWGLLTFVDVNPVINSEEMDEETKISANKIVNGIYTFTDIYPANYNLKLSYKSALQETPVDIDKEKIIELIFPAEFSLDIEFFNSYGMNQDDLTATISRWGKSETKKIVENNSNSFIVPPGGYQLTVESNNNKIAEQSITVLGDKSVDIITKQGSFLHQMIIYVSLALLLISLLIFLWKKNFKISFSLIAIALILIAIASPWWVLTGDDGSTSTMTHTLLFPSKIVSITNSNDYIGGEISIVPDELIMLLSLVSLILIIVCLFTAINTIVSNRFRKTSIALSIMCIVLMLMAIVLFYYGFSQLTNVGVGSFSGSGNLDISIPESQDKVINCSWGAGLGFYLAIIAALCLVIIPLRNRIRKLIFIR
jgi:hypothetical protein